MSAALSTLLLRWYDQHGRKDLPWQHPRDAYRVWLSEVMLQQTQVKTVIPYWERWMRSFPTVEKLAAAPEESVLKAWEGLGYYSRARNLRKAARKVCVEHRGKFPRDFAAVLALPGIGRYTAGAICSIAFGQRTPILDGNVARVLSRVFAVRGSVKSGRTHQELWALSTALVDKASDTSALNQGLMELGATICVPKEPLCSSCPLNRHCAARRLGAVDKFPEPAEKIAMRARHFVALIVRRKGAVLVRKRSADLVNGGLWEFPNLEISREQERKAFLQTAGIPFAEIGTVKHTITRNRITLQAYAGEANGQAKRLARFLSSEWRAISELQQLPFSSAHARLRGLVQSAHGAVSS